MGSLGKAFPTTASVITGKTNGNKVDVTCYWAGDSRCYMLDANGLHQLTADDLDGQDAMSNLSNDGVMQVHLLKYIIKNYLLRVRAYF